MPDPTIRRCWDCNNKAKMFYGDVICYHCKARQLKEQLQETQRSFIVKKYYKIE